jgi:hypothetical protein
MWVVSNMESPAPRKYIKRIYPNGAGKIFADVAISFGETKDIYLGRRARSACRSRFSAKMLCQASPFFCRRSAALCMVNC